MKQKAVVLSVSLLTILATATVSPLLGEIRASFPEASGLAVRMVSALPALGIIAASLVVGRLGERHGVRRTLLGGLVLLAIAGGAGGVSPGLPALLFTRLLVGCAAGIVSPMAQGLIAGLYQGEERVNLMGQSTAVANAGGIGAMLVAGMLAEINWRLAFGVYLLAGVVGVLVAVALPRLQPSVYEANANKRNSAVLSLACLYLALMLGFYLVPTNVALFLQAEGFGEASLAGVGMALLMAASLATGLVFGPLRRKLGRHVTSVGLALMAGGLGMMALAAALGPVLSGMVSVGAGLGLMMPIVFTKATDVAPESGATSALAMMSAAQFAGYALAPLVVALVGVYVADTAIRASFLLAAICMGLAAGIAPFFRIGGPR